MAKFTSAPASVAMPVEALFEKFNDLTILQGMLDKLPEEQRSKVGDVVFDKDSLSIKTPQVCCKRARCSFKGRFRHRIIACSSYAYSSFQVRWS